MPISFPYPVQGNVARPAGQGCLACVHRTYCPAFYWLIRWNNTDSIDNHIGVTCASWSNNVADIVKTITQEDIEKNQYLNIQNSLQEAEPSGQFDPTTSGYYRDQTPS